MSIGEKIKSLRNQLGITQKELAKAIGVARSSISLLENGLRNVTSEELQEISKTLGIKPSTLLDEDTKLTEKNIDILELYNRYKKEFQQYTNRPNTNIHDDLLRKENPYYLSDTNNLTIRYES